MEEPLHKKPKKTAPKKVVKKRVSKKETVPVPLPAEFTLQAVEVISPDVYLKVEETDSRIDTVKASLRNIVFKKKNETEHEMQRRHMAYGLISLVLILMLGSFAIPKGRAEVAMFYPSSCLGGWNNLSKATGKPDAQENEFSNINSAMLPENTMTDLFCGDFKGEIPPNKDPKILILRIAWSKEGSTSTPEIIEGASFASSSGEILDASSSSSPVFISLPEATSTQVATTSESVTPKPSEAAPIPEGVVASSTIQTPPTDAPQSNAFLKTITAFLKKFIENAYAQESTTTTVSIQVATPVDPDVLSQPISTTSQETVPVDTPKEEVAIPQADPATSPIDTPTETPNVTRVSTATSSDDATTTLDVASSTDVVASSTVKVDPFFEIEYTLDGVTWTTLGGVTLEELHATQFEIPLPESASWDDLSKLQVHVKRIATVDNAPTIFLDGMTLEIELQNFEGKRREQKIIDIVNSNDYFIGKEDVQGDVINLLVVSSSTHGGAFYNASGTLLFTTQVAENANYYPMSSLEYGTYIFVATDDPDWCASKTYEECVATTTKTFKGQVEFKVARPVY